MSMSKCSRKIACTVKMLVVAGLIAVVTGCATVPRKSYTGERLSDDHVARISVEEKKQSIWANEPINPLLITHVDGQPLGSFWWSWGGDAYSVVDVLPGERSIVVAIRSRNSPPGALFVAIQHSVETSDSYKESGFVKTFKLNALAGHKYVVKYIERKLPLTYWVEDEATGEVVYGSKPVPAE